ncbi:MAG: sigma-70 family RNA polymerase sigma factor [Oscillospiraceae bacterium]|jgi:RNA polymerase sigma factor (sigma-70 family)|nr:sigma-70 family RNA polymerase sigma factor [Oscillospiraceae bacterium]MCI9580266.1 sigma-70 family RNA polymerase sigma factor [Oscillospiraceae bacterium]
MKPETLFDQVYEAYGPSLYRFCLLHMKNPSDAEDVMQEVFCKRLYRAPKFRSPEHERNWLFQVARNQCRDELRRMRRTELPLEAAEHVSIPPAQLSLLEQASNLPEDQRTALHLYYYEGYQVEEIARLLNISVSSVKMRLKRGRDALREEWRDEV